jgi:hypothetical protein
MEMSMIITVLAMSLVVQETDRPPVPDADALSQQAEGLRHVETDDRSTRDTRTLQEQAREERDANEDRQTQTSDNEADEPPQRRRPDARPLRPARQPDPGN